MIYPALFTIVLSGCVIESNNCPKSPELTKEQYERIENKCLTTHDFQSLLFYICIRDKVLEHFKSQTEGPKPWRVK